MERIVNEAAHQINLLWWGGEELPFREIFDDYRQASNVRDSFNFVRTAAEAAAALGAPGNTINVLFINRIPAECQPFLTANGHLISHKMMVVVPAAYAQFMDRATLESFRIKPFMVFEPQQALRELPAFLERHLASLQQMTR